MIAYKYKYKDLMYVSSLHFTIVCNYAVLSGKPRNAERVELKCGICGGWFHERCVSCYLGWVPICMLLSLQPSHTRTGHYLSLPPHALLTGPRFYRKCPVVSQPCSNAAVWYCGCVVLRPCSTVVVWHCGLVVLRPCSTAAVWYCCHVALPPCSTVVPLDCTPVVL